MAKKKTKSEQQHDYHQHTTIVINKSCSRYKNSNTTTFTTTITSNSNTHQERAHADAQSKQTETDDFNSVNRTSTEQRPSGDERLDLSSTSTTTPPASGPLYMTADKSPDSPCCTRSSPAKSWSTAPNGPLALPDDGTRGHFRQLSQIQCRIAYRTTSF